MKREEKNLQSRRKIINAALQEFSEKNYYEASLNTICNAGDISKGIIYHYFKDKDELYLICTKECFDSLTQYLTITVNMDSKSIESNLQKYFDARISFFDKNPLYLKLFCSAVITPPNHLISAIEEIRDDFDMLNVSILTTLLKKARLRPDITIEEVIYDFRLYQDFINTRYQMQTINQVDIKEHEKRCHHALEILLYGVIEKEI